MFAEQALIKAALDCGLIADQDLSRAKSRARLDQSDVVTTLCYALRIPLVNFYRAYAQQQGLRFLSGAYLRPDIQLARKLGYGIIRSRNVLPMAGADGNTQTALVSDRIPDPALKRQVERLLNTGVEYCLAESRAIQTAMKQLERVLNPQAEAAVDESTATFEPVQTVQEIIDQAYLQRASDIHIEPLRNEVRVRLRTDGRLQEYVTRYTHEEANGLVSRIKVLASLDIAETRMPQDGGMRHRTRNGVEFDLRVATLPAKFGERATLRLLGASGAVLTLTDIGMSDTDLKRFRELITAPYGMILITGPTGSGKSTTLYAALQEISADDINILTAEDPIEQSIETISQLQVGVKVNFANALRSFLRHDPDVIMVGEIRDGETADVAFKAALTGHLVFSTVHTNTAAGSIGRLRDLGVEPYLIGSTLLAAIAQRLVRRLCSACRRALEPEQDVIKKLKVEDSGTAFIYEPAGCPRCAEQGYYGRIALFETLWIDEPVRQAIIELAPEHEIINRANGFSSMQQDAREKILHGHTSVDEVRRLGLI